MTTSAAPSEHDDTALEVSPLSFLAMKTIGKVQKRAQGVLEATIPAHELTQDFIDLMTRRFIMGKYLELLFRACLIDVDIKLGEDQRGMIISRSKIIPGDCSIVFLTDRVEFDQERAKIEEVNYSGEDTIIVFEEREKLVKLQELLEKEHSKTKQGFKSTRDFMHDLFRKLPRSVHGTDMSGVFISEMKGTLLHTTSDTLG